MDKIIKEHKKNEAAAEYAGITAEDLGSEGFCKEYGTKYACYAGAMAGGISSVAMVVVLGKHGYMGSYGSGGQSISLIETAINKIQNELPNGPYLINILANPEGVQEEFELIQMLIRKGATAVEASAFIKPSLALIYYRYKGAEIDTFKTIKMKNRIIAKTSREEVVNSFLSVPDPAMIAQLVAEGWLNDQEAECAKTVPLADDITIEADSGGHTDNRPLVSMFPAMTKLRDQVQANCEKKTRMGAAGGIATGSSILSVFSMGADYVVTGSINQACVEAGTSDYVKELLSKAKMADTMMCPSADMFEAGGKVQVLKLGTMFGQRAQKLYQYYSTYQDYTSIPAKEQDTIEKRILCSSFDEVWEQTRKYFQERNPAVIARAEKKPKYKMALVFRWYLGQASRWAQNDVQDRRMDMQIWCGQSMGAFNLAVTGTELEEVGNRSIVKVTNFIMESAANEFNKLTQKYVNNK